MRESFFLAVANGLPRFKLFDKLRPKLFALAGMKIRGKVTIWGPISIRPIGGASNISVEAGTFINSEVRFGVPSEPVVIGARVLVGPRVMFETLNHDLILDAGKQRKGKAKPILIENDVWIGAGVIITPGVKVGRGAVIAAGAVVTHDIESFTLVAGVPARVIKKLSV